MKCPFCGYEENKVIDSRASKDGQSVRRRRECIDCKRRFTTYEYVEKVPVMIIKRDGRREPYTREKLLEGIRTACRKRPVSSKSIDDTVDDIERIIFSMEKDEIDSKEIGEIVMGKLKELDEISYVRFASVYRQFRDMNEFVRELNKLLKNGEGIDKNYRN
ncbi:TPA: transcriptional regulator NrdR [candidate division WOR-3 bacterium]|jgi:transcriptional repressor NrdR|uniref:Transcriptional repressor NrdR n=1 Tax=candidate division WOR-3 bacterium TaxID=2052148 RepID=A0A350HB66_UNCW3|nr:transcriptional regulator NrdR [candidate division WOR-3 bacterium]